MIPSYYSPVPRAPFKGLMACGLSTAGAALSISAPLQMRRMPSERYSGALCPLRVYEPRDLARFWVLGIVDSYKLLFILTIGRANTESARINALKQIICQERPAFFPENRRG